MAKQLTLTRVARGKLEKDVDKEFDNLTKFMDERFNNLNTNKEYSLKNITEVRDLDLDTATLETIVNAFGTLLKDLQKTGMLKVKIR